MYNSLNIEQTVINYMDRALQDSSFKINLRRLLIEPDREIKLDLPLVLASGEVDTYTAYRVQHNNLMGPYKGGLRLSSNISENKFKALAMLMTFKFSLFNLPFGGAKGGIQVDIDTLSPTEKKKLLQVYIQKLDGLIGAGADIPAPDIGTTPAEMAIISEMLRHKGKKGVHVTGKPVLSGGLEFRRSATGIGIAYATQLAIKKFMTKKNNLDIAVQGFGKVGSVTALLLSQAGHRIVAISDSSCGLFNENGLPIKKISQKLSNSTNLMEVGRELNLKIITNEALLQLEVDILIPAAMESVITKKNVKNINANMIVEAANIPILSDATQALLDAKKIVVPDIFANAGGAIGSYFEWENENKSHNKNTDPIFLTHRLHKMMDQVWQNMIEHFKADKNLRVACYKIAFKNLAKKYEKNEIQFNARSASSG